MGNELKLHVADSSWWRRRCYSPTDSNVPSKMQQLCDSRHNAYALSRERRHKISDRIYGPKAHAEIILLLTVVLLH